MNGDGRAVVKFFVEDICAFKSAPKVTAAVERTEYDIDSHDPDPQGEYYTEIQCHSSIDVEAYARFLQIGIPPRGTVLVTVGSLDITTLIPESELILLDRPLAVGEIVRTSADSAMSGTVIGSKPFYTLSGPTFSIGRCCSTIEELNGALEKVPLVGGVSGDELKDSHDYQIGHVIEFREWIGNIVSVLDEVTISLPNGSVVVPEEPQDLELVYLTAKDRANIGDIVRTKKANLRKGRWIFGAYDPNIPPMGKVVDTRAIQLRVSWLYRRPDLNFSSPDLRTKPTRCLGQDDIDSGKIHVYDRSRLPSNVDAFKSMHGPDYDIAQGVRFKDIDAAVLKYVGNDKLEYTELNGRITKKPRTETQGYDTNVFTVMQTRRRLFVQWQDMTTTEEDSTALVPDPHIDDEIEVWPGDMVCESNSRKQMQLSKTLMRKFPQHRNLMVSSRVGVVQLVKPRDRIAHVRWCSDAEIFMLGDDLLPGSSTGTVTGGTEIVSIYEIQPVEAIQRRRGELVVISNINTIPVDHQLYTSIIDTTKLWWLGEVIDTDLEGRVLVRLGLIDHVQDVRLPVESLHFVYDARNDYDEPMSTDYGSDTTAESSESGLPRLLDSSELPQYEYNYDGGERMDQDSEGAWSTENEDVDMADAETFVSEIRQELSSARVQTHTPGNTDPDGEMDTQDAADSSFKSPRRVSLGAQAIIRGGFATTEQETKSSVLDLSTKPFPTESPPHFDILDDAPPSTHHFINRTSDSSAKRMKHIQKEHKILHNSLPDNIFVRTWESRLDLFRVLIIGPADTPYEYAPFVIDFHLGSNYPNGPPGAFFHSWTNNQGPINPNLYEDGKICLSLLGTWPHLNPEEEWTAARSTLLQVIVSIMGLVLVNEPYYNEAGFEIHIGTSDSALQSALYSERVYFRSRSFITHALDKRVLGFDDALRWLYLSPACTEASAPPPRLLDRAIEASRAIVEKSEAGPSGTVEGWGSSGGSGTRTVSKGAVILLRRQIEALEALRKRLGAGNEAILTSG